MAQGNPPLQQRAGSNNAARPSPFGVSATKLDALMRKVTGSPFTLIERKKDDGTIVLAFALPLTFGYLFNKTPNPITIEIYNVDAQGRRLLSTSSVIPAGIVLPLFTDFLGNVTIWGLAVGEMMELVITAGDPNTGAGLWWWPEKQTVEDREARMEVSRIPLSTSEVVIMDPPPGRTMYPASFPFEGTFRCCYIFNYSPTMALAADVVLETAEGDVVLESALPVAPNFATPILTAFGFGHGFSYPQRLKATLNALPSDGEVFYAHTCCIIDEPSSLCV